MFDTQDSPLGNTDSISRIIDTADQTTGIRTSASTTKTGTRRKSGGGLSDQLDSFRKETEAATEQPNSPQKETNLKMATAEPRLSGKKSKYGQLKVTDEQLVSSLQTALSNLELTPTNREATIQKNDNTAENLTRRSQIFRWQNRKHAESVKVSKSNLLCIWPGTTATTIVA